MTTATDALPGFPASAGREMLRADATVAIAKNKVFLVIFFILS